MVEINPDSSIILKPNLPAGGCQTALKVSLTVVICSKQTKTQLHNAESKEVEYEYLW